MELTVELTESEEWEQKARDVWLRVQRESRKSPEERRGLSEQLLEDTRRALDYLSSISHRIEAEDSKTSRSWKHCTRYTVQSSIWVHCELGKAGIRADSESFVEAFNKFLSRNWVTLEGGILDATDLDTVIELIDASALPTALFVPHVEDPEQYIDQDALERAQGGLVLNMKLVLTLLPLLKLRLDAADGEDDVPAPAGGEGAPARPKPGIRGLALYALQFCFDSDWDWKPSWTSRELSDLGKGILERLIYASFSGGKGEERTSADILAAGVVRRFPELHRDVVDRYFRVAETLDASRVSMFAAGEDNESACALTALLHTLRWLMLGMTYRSYLDEDYSLSEELFPVILHACDTSTQSVQYCGLHCLSLLIKSAPPTVVKWRKDSLYRCLEKFSQHSELTMWTIGIRVTVDASIAMEGKDKESPRLLDLMENLVDQGEIMTSPERFELWFQLTTRVVPCLGARSCCFLGRMISVLDRWVVLCAFGTAGACDHALYFIMALVEHCWPGIGTHERGMEQVLGELSERLSKEDALIARTRKVLDEGLAASKEAAAAIASRSAVVTDVRTV